MDYGKLKREAEQALTGRWGLAAGTYFVYLLVTLPLQFIPKIGGIFALFLTAPMVVGLARFALNIAQGQEARLDDIFSGFKQYTRALGTMFLSGLYIFLWFLCLIVPGIIAAFSYSQIYFILTDDDTLSVEEVLAKSKKMMDGYKMDLFILQLSFIGWALLCVLTLGIGFFFLAPYVQVSLANFYLLVKANYEAENGVVVSTDIPVVS